MDWFIKLDSLRSPLDGENRSGNAKVCLILLVEFLLREVSLETFQDDTLSLELPSWLIGYYNNYNW